MRTRGFTLIELMIVVGIIGLLVAIAIPNFLRFHSRAKQAEARTNLRAAFLAQRTHYLEKATYTESLQLLGFAPERGNRYAYRMSASPVWLSRADAVSDGAKLSADMNALEVDTFRYSGAPAQPPSLLDALVVPGPGGSALIVASGNVDTDAVIDCWSVSTESRASAEDSSPTTCRARNAAGGDPCNDRDDV